MFLFDILKNLFDILFGYIIWLYDIVTRRINKRAEKRLELCNKCEHNHGGICQICGCVIKAKVRVKFDLDENNISIDGCPEQKW